jgi:hypothetical protein
MTHRAPQGISMCCRAIGALTRPTRGADFVGGMPPISRGNPGSAISS